MMSGVKEYSAQRRISNVTVLEVSDILQRKMAYWPEWIQKEWGVHFFIDTYDTDDRRIPWKGISIRVETSKGNYQCPPNGYIVRDDKGELYAYSENEFWDIFHDVEELKKEEK